MKKFKEYSDTEKQFYFYFGLFSTKFSKLEVNVRNMLSAFISDDNVLNSYLFDKNSIQKNIALIKTINTRYEYETDIVNGILSEIKQLNTERNSFIHGVWSEPENIDNEILIFCRDNKMKFIKNPEIDVNKMWVHGKTKKVRLSYIKKLIQRMEDIILSQESFITRLQNYDLEYGISK